MAEKKILVLGGGFGGVKTALDLARKKLPETKIVLVSNRPHFEYHATLYRVLTGKSALQVCVPLAEIFAGTDVEVLEDTVVSVDLKKHVVVGASGSKYQYDTLVAALGAEVAYYNTEGLKEYSFSIDSITSVLKLKRHLHEVISQCRLASAEKDSCFANIVIVGGGVTGCEIAGELATYMKNLAVEHSVDPSIVKIDLIHGGDRLMPLVSPEISTKVEKRLKDLGVTIYLQKQVMKEDIETVYMKDMELKTKTLIWTAGTKTNSLYSTIEGLHFDPKGKVLVDPYMRAEGYENVFVIGDAAVTQYGGMAQTALHQGTYVADIIARQIRGSASLSPYVPKRPIYAIPVGTGWAATDWNEKLYFGKVGWALRKYADLTFFLTILPWRKALAAYNSEDMLWETCPICSE